MMSGEGFPQTRHRRSGPAWTPSAWKIISRNCALGHMSVHMQVRAEDGLGKRLDRMFSDEIRKIAGHDDIGRDQVALEGQVRSRSPQRACTGCSRSPRRPGWPTSFSRWPSGAPDILREPDLAFRHGRGSSRAGYSGKRPSTSPENRTNRPFAALHHERGHSLDPVLLRLVPVHDLVIDLKRNFRRCALMARRRFRVPPGRFRSPTSRVNRIRRTGFFISVTEAFHTVLIDQRSCLS